MNNQSFHHKKIRRICRMISSRNERLRILRCAVKNLLNDSHFNVNVINSHFGSTLVSMAKDIERIEQYNSHLSVCKKNHMQILKQRIQREKELQS